MGGVVVEDSGLLRIAAPGAAEHASCTVLPSLLPLLAAQDASALERVEYSGDKQLVREILFVARNLRWDAAEDLSRFTGDSYAYFNNLPFEPAKLIAAPSTRMQQPRDAAKAHGLS